MLVSGLNYCHHRLRGVLPQLGSNLCLYLIRVLILLFDLLPTVLSLFLAIVVSVVVPVVVFLAPVFLLFISKRRLPTIVIACTCALGSVLGSVVRFGKWK